MSVADFFIDIRAGNTKNREKTQKTRKLWTVHAKVSSNPLIKKIPRYPILISYDYFSLFYRLTSELNILDTFDVFVVAASTKNQLLKTKKINLNIATPRRKVCACVKLECHSVDNSVLLLFHSNQQKPILSL